jgi:hypothetical protein
MPGTPVIHSARQGRPPSKAERPDIPLPNGDVLKPRSRLATQLGVSQRTLARMGVQTTLVAGAAYGSERSALQIIADGLRAPKRQRRR